MGDKDEGDIGRRPRQIEDDRALARQEPAHSVDVAQRPMALLMEAPKSGRRTSATWATCAR
jgi:hypothetical protein